MDESGGRNTVDVSDQSNLVPLSLFALFAKRKITLIETLTVRKVTSVDIPVPQHTSMPLYFDKNQLIRYTPAPVTSLTA